MAKDKPETDVITSEDVGTVESVIPVQLTEEQLKAEMATAMQSGDWKEVSKVARKIDTMQRAKEKLELDAKRQALDGVVEVVKTAYLDAVTPFIDDGTLDPADGIWISHDFGEQAPTVRLTKTATRTPKAGGGTGKKFDVSTTDLLTKYGAEPYKETGMTFSEAYQSNTDKNWRFAIRSALLKKDGII